MNLKKLLGSTLLALSFGSATMTLSLNNAYAAPYFPTTAAATKAAEKIGYKKTNYFSNKQPVYEVTKASKVKGLRYITPDVDSHKGGAWKAARTVEDLHSDKTRLGTYNESLTVRIGD